MKVAVIGGGAAGFFSALSCKEHHPSAQLTLFEKSDKLLSKVKVSGGGRCNVTHACFEPSKLSKFYPRGEKFLKKAFTQFQPTDTIDWFKQRSVLLKTEADLRMFPETNSSQTIIDCFLKEIQSQGIQIKKGTGIESIETKNDQFVLSLSSKENLAFDKLIIASGGNQKIQNYEWISKLGHTILPPVPSLFTFNMPTEGIKQLMGVSVPHAKVHVRGTKLASEGPLLITHWGMSGPAILKLSAWGARILNDLNYSFEIQVNWLGSMVETQLRSYLEVNFKEFKKRQISNRNPFQLPNRLWLFLLEKNEIKQETTWEQISKKSLNQLINTLVNDTYQVKGKTTFKEEFVTCGGVSLDEINADTMESKKMPNLYFAGEIMDIDGITGGFNFQAAWTTGYIAGKLKKEINI